MSEGNVLRKFAVDPYLGFAMPAVFIVGIFFILPLGWLFAVSLGFPDGLSLVWYEQIFSSPGIRSMFLTTGQIVLVTSFISLVIGYFLAYSVASMGDRQRAVLICCILVPFWLSVLARALSWLILLRDNGLINESLLASGIITSPLRLVRNETGVMIGMVHYLIPYAFFPLYGAIRSIDPRLPMAARSLGAGQLRTFVTVIAPLSAPTACASGLLVFIFGLGFYITPALLGGGRVVMLAEYISVTVLQTLRWGLAAALSMVLLTSTLGAILLIGRFVNFRRLVG